MGLAHRTKLTIKQKRGQGPCIKQMKKKPTWFWFQKQHNTKYIFFTQLETEIKPLYSNTVMAANQKWGGTVPRHIKMARWTVGKKPMALEAK